MNQCQKLCYAIFLVAIFPSVVAAEDFAINGMVVKLIHDIELPSLETGPLVRKSMRKGDRVRKGDIIGEIDDRHAQIERDAAKIALSVAKRKLDGFAGEDLAAELLRESTEQVKKQQSILDLAKRAADNDTKLLAADKAADLAEDELNRALEAKRISPDSVSDSEIDGLKLKLDKANLSVREAKFQRAQDDLTANTETAALRIAEAGVKKAKIAVSEAQVEKEVLALAVETASSTLDQKSLALTKYQISAPRNGMIVEFLVNEGEWLRPGDPVARLIDLSVLQAEGFVTLATAKRLKRGQRVVLTVTDEESGSINIEGHIDFLERSVDSVNGEVRVLVQFQNENEAVLPGVHVDARGEFE